VAGTTLANTIGSLGCIAKSASANSSNKASAALRGRLYVVRFFFFFWIRSS
jgi:hypothetical protein